MENPERPIGAIAVPTPADVELRPIGRDDLVAVVALARELHGHPPLDDATPLQPRLDALIGSADAVPMLATDAGEPAGLGVLQFRRRLNDPTFEGWISDLFVRPTARRRGIGGALLEGLVAEWRLRGSRRLQLKIADSSDAATSALLAPAGMGEWMHDFRLRPLPSTPAAALPDGVRIRPLEASDGESVTSLIAEFGTKRTPAPERMDAVLRVFAHHAERVQAGEAASTVAEIGGTLVGACTLEWQRPFWTGETHAWLPDLVVTERYRRRGIGRALVADALARAKAARASQLSLETGRTREAAHSLYRSMGFAEAGRTYLLRRPEAG